MLRKLVKVMLSKLLRPSVIHKILGHFPPVVEVGGMRFFGLFKKPWSRALAMFEKEPDMIKFINEQTNANDVYYDVGANVGIFSIYTATRNLRVFAFEPEASNFYCLNKNIHLNSLQDNCTAYNFAIASKESIDYLYLKDAVIMGQSQNTFGEPINQNAETFAPSFKQGTFGVSIDQLVYKYGLPFPNHIKIDVDGLEAEVLKGASRVLSDKRLKTVACEMNLQLRESTQAMSELLGLSGFRECPDYSNEAYAVTEIENKFFVRD